MLVEVQSHMLVLTLLGWRPACPIQFWLHHTESRSSLLLRTLQHAGSLALAL